MWANGIVVSPPALDHDLRFLQGIEDFPVQQLVAQAGVEALDVTVLPRATRSDVGGLGTDRGNPFLHGLGDELGPIVRPDVPRNSTQDEVIGQNIDHVDGLQLARHPDRQALVRELVEDIEHAILPPIMRAMLDEVVGPHVIAMLRSQADARTIRQPQTTSFGLLLGNLQPLTSPNPLDPFVVHNPASVAKQGCDFAVAVATILPGELDDVGRQPLLVVAALRRLALCRAVLAERRTGATLGDAKLTTNMLDADTATRRAQ
jgi:hypothetical protein